MAADLQQFIYADTYTPIQINKVLEVCSNNTFEIFMAGPFKDTNIVGIDYNFVDKIDKIQVKFNFMAFIQDITLIVTINDNVALTKPFNIFSDLYGMYGKNPNNTGPNHLFLNALSPYNVDSVISPVDTGCRM
jgi:hypothetical protein